MTTNPIRKPKSQTKQINKNKERKDEVEKNKSCWTKNKKPSYKESMKKQQQQKNQVDDYYQTKANKYHFG